MIHRTLILIFAIFALTLPVMAQTDDTVSPPQQAQEVRQALFDAQIALMSGDTQNARAAVSQTAATAEIAFSTFDEASTAQLDRLFTDLDSAITAGDSAAFASVRSQVWTTVLQGGAEIVLSAIEAGDGDTAALWLPLREFRASNRFSRPDADATLAVAAMRRGILESESVYATVQAELYDTYQGQLLVALDGADSALENNFSLRQAEEASLAAGYFEILSPAFAEQRSDQALADMRAVFANLISASLSGDTNAFATARAAVDSALNDFRAAPLTEEELIRRTGQLMRYIALVPVEYARGVREGVVTNSLEIQEALTFHTGAAAAFADLRPALSEQNANAAHRVDTLLTDTLNAIHSTADPAALQATVDEMTSLLNELIPADWISTGGESDIDVIVSILDGILPTVAAGDYTAAESARLEAYATLELGIEQRLRGFAPEMALEIESLFWQGTSDTPGLSVLLTTDAPLSQVRVTVTALKQAFTDASLILGAEQSAPAAVVTNAAIIVFREGLEAVLILASLIASLRTAEQRRFRRPLLIGAALAFVATGGTWIVASSVLNILLPLGERLEAIVSLIAIGVLILVTNWFFHKTYWTGWMANFHTRKHHLIGGMVAINIGQMLGLVLLGFTSIFREGVETVLFLQSLVLEAGTNIVLQGVFLGLLGTAIVGVVTFSLQVRLPYKKMLIVTGIFIGAVLLTMVGNTVHVMQSVGWLPITPIQGLYLPFWMGQWFGVFATWQGIILQFVAAAFVIGSYFLAENQKIRSRQQHRVSNQTPNPV